MTENFYRAETYKPDYTTFGGLIYPSDFNTDYRSKSNTSGSSIASRIITDKRFDNLCRKNLEITKTNGGLRK